MKKYRHNFIVRIKSESKGFRDFYRLKFLSVKRIREWITEQTENIIRLYPIYKEWVQEDSSYSIECDETTPDGEIHIIVEEGKVSELSNCRQLLIAQYEEWAKEGMPFAQRYLNELKN